MSDNSFSEFSLQFINGLAQCNTGIRASAYDKLDKVFGAKDWLIDVDNSHALDNLALQLSTLLFLEAQIYD